MDSAISTNGKKSLIGLHSKKSISDVTQPCTAESIDSVKKDLDKCQLTPIKYDAELSKLELRIGCMQANQDIAQDKTKSVGHSYLTNSNSTDADSPRNVE